MPAKNKRQYEKVWWALAFARISLGFIFLWAFLDKLFGLGYATPAAKSWLHGGSPTTGFLISAKGPFAQYFHNLAGHGFIDWLFMIGLLAIGSALILGIALRLAAIFGTMMLLLMWAASLPIAVNPFMDEHIIYILLLVIIALSPRYLSFINWWCRYAFVNKNPWLW